MKQGTLRISVPYTKDPANKPYKTKRLSSPQPKTETMIARYTQWLIDNKKDRYYVFTDAPGHSATQWRMRRNLPGVQEIQVSRADYVFDGVPDNERI